MVYEYFRAAGAYEAEQGLADLFTMNSQNDNVQDFDVRWDHALLSVSEMPTKPNPGRIAQVKITEFRSTSGCDGLVYDQEVARNNGTPKYQQLKTAVKLHNCQIVRNRNFRVRSDVVERGSGK